MPRFNKQLTRCLEKIETIKSQLENLERYYEDPSWVRSSIGLCYSCLDGITPISHFISWKHYSGDANYPVEGSMSEWLKFSECRNDPTTKYGSLRRNLALHLIGCLTEDLRNEQIRLQTLQN